MVNKLNKRERIAVYAVSGLVGFILIYELIVSPLAESRERRERVLVSKSRERKEMIHLKSEYETIQQKVAATGSRFVGRKANFTLFSFLDGLAGEAKIKDHISYMKPSTSTPKDSPYKISQVEMKLQNVTMEQLTTYLYKVETSTNMVFVKRLSISKDSKQSGFINAVLQVETLEV